MDAGKIKIVVIDDNPDNLVSFRALIQEVLPGASLFATTDGKEGMQHCREKDPDVLFLDVVMPGMDGFEVCSRVKADPATRDIPVVFITAIKGDRESRVKALEVGAEGFLAKPIDSYELQAQVNAMAKIRAAHREKQAEKSRLEELLREHMDKFTIIFRESPVPAALIKLDGVRLLEVNQAWLALTGFTAEEALDSSLTELGVIDRTTRSLLAETYQKAGCIRQKEISVSTKSGRSRIVLASAAPVIISGEDCVISHMVDITQNKQNEKALRHRHELMRYIIEHDRSAIAVHDKDYRYIYVSQRYLEDYNVREADVIGKHHYEVFPDLPQKWREAHRKALEGHVSAMDDDPYHRDDGTMEWTRWECRPWYEADGSIGGFVVYTEVITERKNIELELLAAKERAQESDRLKTAFLANMSHEIRTPMNGILGFAQILKDPRLSEAQQEHFIDVIEKSGQRLLNLINDIIDVSKIESGHKELFVSEVSVYDTLKFMFGFFDPVFQTGKPGVEFSVEMPEEDIQFVTDRDKLHSVLVNLIRNAEKFTNEGKVVFGCYREDSSLVWYVKDTGIGIAQDKQSKVFERFFQADLSFSRGYEGAGLGLSISKAFVEMMGGRIWLNSEPGKGSEFYFSLPPEPETGSHQVILEEAAPPPGKKFTKKAHIMVVEDDRASFEVIRFMLEEEGFQLSHAETGEEAIELFSGDHHFDLILMDIKMPGIDGYQTTREIRKINGDIPIIAQTAHALSGDKEKSLSAGCNDYLTKPIKKELLLNKIRTYLSHS